MRSVVMAGLALTILCSQAQAEMEWSMQIYSGDSIKLLAVADLDSLAFFQGPPGMIWIPAGSVRLGHTGIAEPVHDVFVDGFWISRLQVTNGQYAEFIDSGGYHDEELWHPVGWQWRQANSIYLPGFWEVDGAFPWRRDYPVNGVSWWEADAYCRRAGMRLPTEAEWEKAAKGPSPNTPSFPWGGGILPERANYNHYDTTPVGRYNGSGYGDFWTVDSPSAYGLYDMLGNVWEWTSTKREDYPYDPTDGREDPPLTYGEWGRVVRGAAYDVVDSSQLHSAYRLESTPQARYATFGFRTVWEKP